MYNLSSPSDISEILQRHGFHLSKTLGQNFLINGSVCPRMAEMCGADQNTGVLEIGPGVGVLTAELAKRAQKVVSVELDKRLLPVLKETLAEYGNISIILGDILKIDLMGLCGEQFAGQEFCVCANLPYYITSPVIMHLLESGLPLRTITVMVQKEAARRLCALPGSRECGAVSVGVHYRCRPEILFDVGRSSFMPPPNVDSAVIRLNMLRTPPVNVTDEGLFFRLVKAAFGKRRKTLVNSVSSSLPYEKTVLADTLRECGLSETIRAERMTMENFAQLSNLLAVEKGG